MTKDQLNISFRGEIFVPMLSGALFWPAENTLLVADLHFEKMSSFAGKGQLLPPYDTKATLARLESDIVLCGATRVICLGDSFHRDEGTTTLPADELKLLKSLTSRLDWLWLAGNHDPLPHQLGGRCAEQLAFGDLVLSHEPTFDLVGQIGGHLHPSARISANGRATRRPCFVLDERLMILPAYGVSTGTLNILSKPFAGLFERKKLKVIMLGKNRLYPVAIRFLI